MKFSITTSFYNTKKYVNDVYQSLAEQTYCNWEWIVTDDWSDDDNNSKDLLLKISKKDDRVKYIEQKFKQELYWNPHKYSSFDADFILHLGSDDILYPKALEVYKHFFLKYPNIFSIISGGTRIHEDKKENNWKNYLFCDVRNLNTSDVRNKFGKVEETLLITKAWRHIPYPTLDFNPNNECKLRLEDLNILLKIEEIGKILPLNRNLCDITVRKKSLSSSSKYRLGHNEIVDETKKHILDSTDFRRTGFEHYSFNKVFENEYDFLCLLYYGDLSKSQNFHIINMLSYITPAQRSILKELYFDFDFKYNNFVNNTDYNFYFIQNANDYDTLINDLNNFIKYKKLIIFLTNDEYFLNLKKLLNTKGIYYWRTYNKFKWIELIN